MNVFIVANPDWTAHESGFERSEFPASLRGKKSGKVLGRDDERANFEAVHPRAALDCGEESGGLVEIDPDETNVCGYWAGRHFAEEWHESGRGFPACARV